MKYDEIKEKCGQSKKIVEILGNNIKVIISIDELFLTIDYSIEIFESV